MRLARDAGALVSMDLNLRPSLWPRGVDPAPRLWRALARADLVKLCREEARLPGRRATAARTRCCSACGQGARAVRLVTDGAAPIRWFTRDAAGHGADVRGHARRYHRRRRCLRRRLAAPPRRTRRRAATGSRPCLDDRSRLADALRHAAAGGALATTRHGAFAAMPSRERRRATAASRPHEPAPPRPSPDFRKQAFLRAHIADTMAFYHPRAIDPAGGFFHYFRDDGSVYDAIAPAPRQQHALRLQLRDGGTRVRANAARDEYLDAARHGLRYLRDVHRDPRSGGYAWTMRDGVAEDRTNHCYGVAFVLLAYATALQGRASTRPRRGWTRPGSCWKRASGIRRTACIATRPTRTGTSPATAARTPTCTCARRCWPRSRPAATHATSIAR